jgi:hypothetical protein
LLLFMVRLVVLLEEDGLSFESEVIWIGFNIGTCIALGSTCGLLPSHAAQALELPELTRVQAVQVHSVDIGWFWPDVTQPSRELFVGNVLKEEKDNFVNNASFMRQY